MAEQKRVKLIAGANGVWTGTERIEPGQTFEASEKQAAHLIRKGSATEAPKEEAKSRGQTRNQPKAQESEAQGDASGGE